MSIFKRKTKGEKATTEKSKKEGKESVKTQTPTEKPALQPYRPTHAASDAVRKPVIPEAQKLSPDAAQYAQGTGRAQHQLGQNGGPSVAAQAGMRHVLSGGSNALPPYRGFNGMNTMQRNNTGEVFTTDPDAPPMPSSSTHGHEIVTPMGRKVPSRNPSGYFGQAQNAAPSFDNPNMLGNQKMAVAARDRGYIDPQTSGDSGYGSTSHSRAPSEHEQASRPHLPRDTSGFLPELSLSEELARDPAFSEASFGGDEPAEQPATTPKARESVLRNRNGYFSQLDPGNDSRAAKPGKEKRTEKKQARFEQAPEAVQEQKPKSPIPTIHTQQLYLPQPVQEARPESATLPPPSLSLPERTSTPPVATYGEPKPSFSMPIGHSTPPPQRLPEPQPQYTAPARLSTPPPAREQIVPPVRFSSPPPQHASAFPPLERFISPSIRSDQPPVGALNGFKVNKRGKILDEEGEIIGELIEGDIMDCVRQRCNAYGEVLDDHGRVVGRVQPTEHSSMDSPVMRVASPALSPQAVTQQNNYFAAQLQQRSQTPLGHRQPRRESAVSQPEMFTPAWQRQSQNSQPHLAWELRNHLAAAEPRSHQVIPPAEYPGNVTAVELDAGEEQAVEPDEVLPLFDHSEVFMPVPVVPPRSAKRSETPSPPVERVDRQWAASQLIDRRSKSPSPAKQAVQEAAQAPSRHVSAPTAPREQPRRQAAPSGSFHASIYEESSHPQAPSVEPPAPRQPKVQTARQLASSQGVHASVYEQQAQAQAPSVQDTLASLRNPAPAPAAVQVAQQDVQRTASPAQAQQLQHEQMQQQNIRRTLLRSASDSSMSDIAKSYSRPSMSPVPEDGDAPTNDVLSQERSPALFSYKGEIPAESNAKLAPSRVMGAKSPPLPTFPRQAFNAGLPTSSPFQPPGSGQLSPASARGQPPRQFTTGVPGPRPIPSFQQRSSYNAPLKRSPLGSHETTPPDSDQGSNDGDNKQPAGMANGMHSRQPSLRSMRSMQSQAGKPRTYFTHGGRVNVQDGDLSPSQAADVPEKEAAPSVSGASTASKKRSRFSLAFGSKKGQTVSAH